MVMMKLNKQKSCWTGFERMWWKEKKENKLTIARFQMFIGSPSTTKKIDLKPKIRSKTN